VLLLVALEARSELVGVQVFGYSASEHYTTQASWCSSASVADAKSFRAPAILFASEAAG
jgi:hypothetical protein